jgi:hypothetical protein
MIYSQAIGVLTLPSGLKFQGHAGRGEGLNNPVMQHVKNTGPLPRWDYTLGPWKDGTEYSHADARLGPFVSRLTPDSDPNGEMCGRDGFFIHGGNNSNPPTDSEGCIVLPHAARAAIANSGETRLQVVK